MKRKDGQGLDIYLFGCSLHYIGHSDAPHPAWPVLAFCLNIHRCMQWGKRNASLVFIRLYEHALEGLT
jgi:hypothetical protein